MSDPLLGRARPLGEKKCLRFGGVALPNEIRSCHAARWLWPTTVCVLLLYLAKIMRKALQILAVEDEKAVAQILAVVLGGPMAKVIRAADGWEALIKVGAAARPFDVVITDHRMPRMGGLELVRRLRTRNFEGKILVLSAHLSDEDIRAYEEFGVDMMMSKPFDFEEIQNAVAILTKGASVAVAA